MLTPNQLEELTWLTTHRAEKNTKEYVEKFNRFKGGLAKEDRHFIADYNLEPPKEGEKNNSIFNQIEKVEWYPGQGFTLTVNAQKCILLDNKLFDETYFKRWYILQFGQKPDFEGLSYDQFVDYVLGHKEEVQTEDLVGDKKEDLIGAIVTKIKARSSKGIAMKDKEELKGKNRSSYHLYDDDFYYVSREWIENKLKSEGVTAKMAGVFLKDIYAKTWQVRIGDDRQRYWRFKKKKIDDLWDAMQNEGQVSL